MENNDKRREQHHAVFNNTPEAKQVEVNLHIAPVEEPVEEPSTAVTETPMQEEQLLTAAIDESVNQPIDTTQTKETTIDTEEPLEIQTRTDMGTPVGESATVTDLTTNLPPQTEVSTPVTLTTDPFINAQLLRGLDGIKEKYDASNMAKVSDHHVDIFNAFTRAVANLPQPEFNNLLHNLLNYYHENKDGHGASKIILQGVETSTLSPSKQRDYYTMFATLHSLKDPSTRAKKAKNINWDSVAGRMNSDQGLIFSDKVKKCFNI
jgi:hypothetical protein